MEVQRECLVWSHSPGKEKDQQQHVGPSDSKAGWHPVGLTGTEHPQGVLLWLSRRGGHLELEMPGLLTLGVGGLVSMPGTYRMAGLRVRNLDYETGLPRSESCLLGLWLCACSLTSTFSSIKWNKILPHLL